MPCITPDGKPTSTGLALLRSLKEGMLSSEEIARISGLSLPRVRSGLRELEAAGFIEEVDGRHRLSQSGREIV